MSEPYEGIHKHYVTGKVPHAYSAKCVHANYWNIIGYMDGCLKVLSGTNESEAAAWALACDRLDDISAQQILGETFYIKPMIDNKTSDYDIVRDAYINGLYDSMTYIANFIDNSNIAMSNRQRNEFLDMNNPEFINQLADVFMSGLESR